MTDATTARRAPTPDDALRIADSEEGGPLLDAAGVPLKSSLARAIRREKLRHLGLIAPLLLFILIAFRASIADMLFRSVENSVVPDTLRRTTAALEGWNGDSGDLPGQAVFEPLAYDLTVAAERKLHTRLGPRLNYETSGISSLFRRSGRRVDDIGEIDADQFIDLDPAREEPATWVSLMASEDRIETREAWAAEDEAEPRGLSPQ